MRWFPFLCLLVLGGCTAAVVGGGAVGGAATYKYVSGRLEIYYGYSYDQVWKAVSSAVKDLEFSVLESKKDALEGKLVCKSSSGKKVKIVVQKMGAKVTKVTVKVGWFGDLNFSLKVKEKIDENLLSSKEKEK